MTLLTIAEQQEIKPIAEHNKKEFAQLAQEVEISDLQDLISREFYQEIIRNPQKYKELLNGGSYTYCGNTYTFRGLKAVMAYLIYARYIRQSYIKDTYSGMVQHTQNDFQRVSAGELQNQELRYKAVAGGLWDDCLQYIREKGYPYFNQNNSGRKFKIGAL